MRISESESTGIQKNIEFSFDNQGQELMAFYDYQVFLESADVSLVEILQATRNLLLFVVPALQICGIRIQLNGKEYKTPDFCKADGKLVRPVNLNCDQAGILEFFYGEDDKNIDSHVALERAELLVTYFAKRISGIIDRFQANQRVERLTRVLGALRDINQLIVREQNRDILLKKACDILTNSRGYSKAWILLLNQEGIYESHAESEIGTEFEQFLASLKSNDFPACVNQALKYSDILEVKEKDVLCTSCSFKDKCTDRERLITRLEYDHQIYGVLSVSVNMDIVFDQKEISLFDELAGDIAFALNKIIEEEKRSQMECALKASEKQYQNLFNAMLNGFALHEIICDETGKPVDYRFIEVNPAFEKITGLKSKDIIGKTVLEVLPDTEPYFIEKYGDVALTGEPLQFVEYSQEFDKFFEIIASQAQANQFVTIFSDITDKIRADEEIKSLSKFPNENPSPVLRFSKVGIILYASKSSEALLKMWGKSVGETVPLEWKKEILNAFLSGKSSEIEKTFEDRTFSFILAPIQEMSYVNAYGRDITEYKQVMKELKHKSQLIATLYEAGKQLGKTLDLDTIYENLYGTIRQFMSCDDLIVSSYDASTGLINCTRMWHEGAPMDVSGFPPIPLESEGKGIQSRVIHSGKSLYISDLQAYLRSIDNYYFVDDNGIRECKDVPDDELTSHSALIVPLILEDHVTGVIQVFSYFKEDFTEENLRFLEAFSPQVAAATSNAALYKQTVETKGKLQQSVEGTINTIAATVEVRDPYTAGHQHRVAELGAAIAREMQLSEDQIKGIYMSGLIHDLGKIKIPSEILSKPGGLTDLEFSLIKIHPQVGFELLRDIEFPWPIANIVLQHHERMDGSGYPQGIQGDDIMLEARILAVADVVEAVSSHRPYRPALGTEKAFEIIQGGRGILFDPEAVDACLKVFEQGYELV